MNYRRALRQSVRELEALPRRMMYQTFRQIVEYLLESGEIALDRSGYVVWIHNPDLFAEYHGRDDLRIG